MVWGNTCHTNLSSLFIKLKHIIYDARYREPTSQLFYNLKLLVKIQTAILMYKAFNTMLPINLLVYFSRKLTMNECVTRQINAFEQPCARTTIKQQCVSIVGVKVWNNIDHCMTCSKNIYAWKILMKK